MVNTLEVVKKIFINSIHSILTENVIIKLIAKVILTKLNIDTKSQDSIVNDIINHLPSVVRPYSHNDLVIMSEFSGYIINTYFSSLANNEKLLAQMLCNLMVMLYNRKS